MILGLFAVKSGDCAALFIRDADKAKYKEEATLTHNSLTIKMCRRVVHYPHWLCFSLLCDCCLLLSWFPLQDLLSCHWVDFYLRRENLCIQQPNNHLEFQLRTAANSMFMQYVVVTFEIM